MIGSWDRAKLVKRHGYLKSISPPPGKATLISPRCIFCICSIISAAVASGKSAKNWRHASLKGPPRHESFQVAPFVMQLFTLVPKVSEALWERRSILETPFHGVRVIDCQVSQRMIGDAPGSHSCAEEYRQCSAEATQPRRTGFLCTYCVRRRGRVLMVLDARVLRTCGKSFAWAKIVSVGEMGGTAGDGARLQTAAVSGELQRSFYGCGGLRRPFFCCTLHA